MTDNETNLDTSELYHSALDTLMANLQIDSTPTSDSSYCNNTFRNCFYPADESKFFSFCSTIQKYSKNDKSKSANIKAQNTHTNYNPAQNLRETPKRLVNTTRKQKLFESTESIEEFKPATRHSLSEKELSPNSLLLKKAITRLECMQRRQERMALNKKPVRTSLRV